MGVGLVEACLFDTLDSLLFEYQIEGPATGSFPGTDGPCQRKRSSTREEKHLLLAEDIRRDLLDFGNRITSPEVKKKLFTKANEVFNPPKRKKNERHLLEKRIETVKAHARNIKVSNNKTINSFKREYNITSGTLGRTRRECLDVHFQKKLLWARDLFRMVYVRMKMYLKGCQECQDLLRPLMFLSKFRKNGKKIVCKHILFILICILGVEEND